MDNKSFLESLLPTLKLLSPAEKKAAAIVLAKSGMSSRTLEDYIGADHTTISRWANEELTQEMQQFATEFRGQIEMMKRKGMSMALDRLMQLIPDSKSIEEVIRALGYLEGSGGAPSNQTNLQINFNDLRQRQKEKYGI